MLHIIGPATCIGQSQSNLLTDISVFLLVELRSESQQNIKRDYFLDITSKDIG